MAAIKAAQLGLKTVIIEKEEVVEQPAVRAVIKEDAEEGNRLGAILLLSLGGQLFTLALPNTPEMKKALSQLHIMGPPPILKKTIEATGLLPTK